MSVWQEIGRYKLPVVCLHQHSGQAEGCLAGLVHYAAQIAQNKHTYAFRTPYSIIAWLWQQSVKLDRGDGPSVSGCFPAQRSRVWPDDGLNCWEATAHLLGVAFCHQWMIELHLFDAPVNGQRHVFPAIRPLYHFEDFPVPLVLQPPVRTGKIESALKHAAQAWQNDLLGGIHIVGDKVLRAFGVGDLADELANLEGDELPDWARTAKQKEARAAALIKQAAAKSSHPSDASKNTGTIPEKRNDGKEMVSQSDLDSLRQQVADLAAQNKALEARLQLKGA